jgi:predicted RNase H-like HicB family nuclease
MNERRVAVTWESSGHWIVRVPGVNGGHTYGTSIRQALRRIREALLLWVDDPPDTAIVPTFQLPGRVCPIVRTAVAARDRAERAQEASRTATTDAARVLTDAGFSRRDAATLLGVSHQRIQQLLAES